jgi:hypothetical protein
MIGQLSTFRLRPAVQQQLCQLSPHYITFPEQRKPFNSPTAEKQPNRAEILVNSGKTEAKSLYFLFYKADNR